MSSAEENQHQTPSTEIDGLKVKEVVQANLLAHPSAMTKSTPSPLAQVDVLGVVSKTSPSKIVKKKVTRCHCCKSKIPLALVMKCKCGEVYCAMHRLAEAHQCSFDFKSNDRIKLAENLEKVVGAKVAKI
ncbi:hypothetical protein AKO1_013604 [Acrasis kona]|uniref:AN1-type domain-containing protein n=1 Tax=Acrasis kona TaxID=1008807 RepID=A0AAW2YVY3_9EUKA